MGVETRSGQQAGAPASDPAPPPAHWIYAFYKQHNADGLVNRLFNYDETAHTEIDQVNALLKQQNEENGETNGELGTIAKRQYLSMMQLAEGTFQLLKGLHSDPHEWEEACREKLKGVQADMTQINKGKGLPTYWTLPDDFFNRWKERQGQAAQPQPSTFQPAAGPEIKVEEVENLMGSVTHPAGLPPTASGGFGPAQPGSQQRPMTVDRTPVPGTPSEATQQPVSSGQQYRTPMSSMAQPPAASHPGNGPGGFTSQQPTPSMESHPSNPSFVSGGKAAGPPINRRQGKVGFTAEEALRATQAAFGVLMTRGRVLAWRQGAQNGAQCIVEYGEGENVAYRLEPGASQSFDKSSIPQLKDQSVGERRRLDNQYQFQEKDMVGYSGVAWRAHEAYSHDDLEPLRPVPKKWYPTTFVRVEWKDHAPTWEPRGVIRRILKGPHINADCLIYTMAHEQEMGFKESHGTTATQFSIGVKQENEVSRKQQMLEHKLRQMIAQDPQMVARVLGQQGSTPAPQHSVPAPQHFVPAPQPSVPASQPSAPASQPSAPAPRALTVPGRSPSLDLFATPVPTHPSEQVPQGMGQYLIDPRVWKGAQPQMRFLSPTGDPVWGPPGFYPMNVDAEQ
ncbi:MAG: hypothetical protein M1823_006076 [Watsoniomyces obsoletus]|nr:MAG: hypothetical protein M1823_006076 [Watsoniomyces obsoletus]